MRFPEATTFHYLYTILEDRVLEAWLDHIKQYDFEHVSLHFDGVRIRMADGSDIGAFCRASERAIEDPLDGVSEVDSRWRALVIPRKIQTHKESL
jgi:hypothetical protein